MSAQPFCFFDRGIDKLCYGMADLERNILLEEPTPTGAMDTVNAFRRQRGTNPTQQVPLKRVDVVQVRREYRPYEPVIQIDGPAPSVNLWTPSDALLAAKELAAPVTELPELFAYVLRHAVGGGDADFAHVLNWLAALFQIEPGHEHYAQNGTSIQLHGTQGTGKGIITDQYLQPLLGASFTKVSGDVWRKEFTAAFLNRILVNSDEFELHPADRARNAIEARIKAQVASATASFEDKQVSVKSALNLASHIFTTNSMHGQVVEAGDRRKNIYPRQEVKIDSTPEGQNIINAVFKGGAAAEQVPLASFLMNYKVDWRAVRRVHQTQERIDLQERSKLPQQDAVDRALDGDLEHFIRAAHPSGTLLAGLGLMRGDAGLTTLDSDLVAPVPEHSTWLLRRRLFMAWRSAFHARTPRDVLTAEDLASLVNLHSKGTLGAAQLRTLCLSSRTEKRDHGARPKKLHAPMLGTSVRGYEVYWQVSDELRALHEEWVEAVKRQQASDDPKIKRVSDSFKRWKDPYLKPVATAGKPN